MGLLLDQARPCSSSTEGRGSLTGGRTGHFRAPHTLQSGPCMQNFHSDEVQKDVWLIYEESHNSRERPVPLCAPIMELCGGKPERCFSEQARFPIGPVPDPSSCGQWLVLSVFVASWFLLISLEAMVGQDRCSRRSVEAECSLSCSFRL